MKTPEHMFNRKGECPRCGLSVTSSGGPYCPPGFWMTKTEIARWYECNAEGQKTVERRALAARGRHDEPSSSAAGGSDG